MFKSDIVIADHPDSRPNRLIRCYGIVQETTKICDVIIEMSDGSVIKRKFQSIAVYIQPPQDWRELFTQQQSVLSQQMNQMMARSSYLNLRNN